jgi:hypothetical protein
MGNASARYAPVMNGASCHMDFESTLGFTTSGPLATSLMNVETS